MADIGVSFCREAVECKKLMPELIKTIEAGSLANLEAFGGDWTFHCRKEDPFNWSSPSLHLLKTNQLKLLLDNQEMQKALRVRPPKIISFHLGHSAKVLRQVYPDNHDEAVGDTPSRDEVFETFCQSLEIIQESFLARELHLPIALENLDYHPGGAYEYICQSDFINDIFAKNPDLYLLLDVAHAEISAKMLFGGNTKGYLQSLPLDRLVEIHINSPRFMNGQAEDMHLPITCVEAEILKWLLSRGLPNFKTINLECGEKIAEQISQLNIVKKGGE